MNILLFGGAFDPPHKGHLNLIKQALNFKNFDKVIVMPTGTPGHKSNCVAPFEVRKKMVELTFSSLKEDIEIDDFEGYSKEKSYSFLTIDYLKNKYPNSEITFLIGGDSLINFSSWKEWQYILNNVTLMVVPRQENYDQLSQAITLMQEKGGKIILLDCERVEISSTFIKKSIEYPNIIKDYLDVTVWDLIKYYSIYSFNDIERQIGTAKLLVEIMLDKKRAEHTFNVAKLAQHLAKIYNEDINKATLAALLHDIMKQSHCDIILHRAMQSDIMEKIIDKPKPTLHGFAAADFALKELKITDVDVLMAIKSHTCGRVGMSNLEKIIYLADMLSEERDFPQKDYLLSYAFENLDKAMLYALKESIAWLKSKNSEIDKDSLQALEFFEKLPI